jgi:hypothetical protein
VAWVVSQKGTNALLKLNFKFLGMGTLHAWESFGDGARPDIQAVAKGLGGGSVSQRPAFVDLADIACSAMLRSVRSS